MTISRRNSLRLLSGVTAGSFLSSQAKSEESTIHLATNTYPWSTFARRRGEKLIPHSNQLLAEIAACGLSGYEPIINSSDEFEGLGERLASHNLEMRSLYVNSTLHDSTLSEESIGEVLAIASAAKKLGTAIFVTNPAPIQWGGKEDKTDSQLRFQAGALDELGEALRAIGITLAYHNHDSELRNGAREFHHMLTATRSENVKFCLDAHWIFRGCGNSEVAVFDVLKRYQDRIVELHLRQSQNGIWDEAFSLSGDINYGRLIKFLHEAKIHPHLVLEQSVEKESANTKSVVVAHREGRDALFDFLL